MRKNLKEARAAAGLTQQQMADKLGLTQDDSCVWVESGEGDGGGYSQ